jgi:polysaccharide pyruvyl transferase WcaK-like protein
MRDEAGRPLVIGYYGMDNAGDNSFCVVMDWALGRYWGATAPVFAAPPLVDLPPERTALDPRWVGSQGLAQRAGNLSRKAALLRHSSMVVYGGGSVFREMGPLSEKRLFSWHARLTGHPVAAVGVSVGPFVSAASERRLVEVLRRIPYIAVRDTASAEALHAMGYPGTLTVAADLAGLLPEALGEDPCAPRVSRNQRPRLGVTLLGVDYEASQEEVLRRERALIDGVRMLADKEPIDVTIFVFNTHSRHGDLEVSHRLRSELTGRCEVREVTERDGVARIWREMKECDLGVHMRLHGAIFSYMAGVPFVLVPYQRKCDDFLDEIGQPGSLRLDPKKPDATTVFEVLAGLLNTPELPSVTRQRFADRARLNFTAAPWHRPPAG